MRICGIKLTHDGAVAVVEDGRLLFCIEQEKRDNNTRYQAITDLSAVTLTLAEHGLTPADIDRFVIDGWDGLTHSQFDVLSQGVPLTLKGAPYVERHENGLLTPYVGSGLVLNGTSLPYRSYAHVAGHVAGAYCTSPFAKAQAPALCLVWDGCIFPRLYHVGPAGARFLDTLFPVIGQAYAIAGHRFGPYRQAGQAGWDLGVAGKLMAYIALGVPDEAILAVFQELYEMYFAGSSHTARAYRDSINDPTALLSATDRFFEECALRLLDKRQEDVLASFHVFAERLLEQEVSLALLRHSELLGLRNLCIAGGCGLNIKWNSTLRATGLFDTVWVPPFPNDSGSAIGTACAAMAETSGLAHLEWSVHSGPALTRNHPSGDWDSSPCTIEELAALIATDVPVVFLSGLAELGPRALGGRSIIAAATSSGMKNHLNDVKLRERFRPVAPICLEDRAPEIFDPGSPDPYMLFDHQTRPEWRTKVPAIVHLDGSARLQTISRTSPHAIAALLVEYEKLTGIPLLCNTSANHHGRGFFPDVASACGWGGVDHVWCDGILWKRSANADLKLSNSALVTD
ncbi:nodulation protein NodU [Bradyrhizobium sp. DOA9]|uniref:nodulation protein NodU n=1 Tax=Bradyrhizobium sp. DOA9 TaxID=1126627 RepID=UPI000468EC3D|nr:nodulation protein NodU [Bradyrhizobium sp. DOA9]GAJ37736.1 nodulation protein U [Bradyrhizobium sp. DOA9]